MQDQAVQEIIECLPKGTTRFYYFKDRYALMLLAYTLGSGKPVHQVRHSRCGQLLNKPIIKNVLGSLGNGELTRSHLDAQWPRSAECYRLTLGQWGSCKDKEWTWNQTSRKGANLVLQLNFSSKHDRPYYQLIQPDERHPFAAFCHPIARDGYLTLAWSRLDIDLDRGEALIEEIQTDWIRFALECQTMIDDPSQDDRRHTAYLRWRFRGLRERPIALKRYMNEVLQPHLKLWDEAMLAATVWFLREEIGIRSIFYHTFESGNELKALSGCRPPRSLYTDLPKKFCFVETESAPHFLYEEKTRRIKKAVRSRRLRFFRLDL